MGSDEIALGVLGGLKLGVSAFLLLEVADGCG